MNWRVQRITARDDGKPTVDWLALDLSGCLAGDPEWRPNQRDGHVFTFREAAALRLALIAQHGKVSDFYLVSEHQEAFHR